MRCLQPCNFHSRTKRWTQKESSISCKSRRSDCGIYRAGISVLASKAGACSSARQVRFWRPVDMLAYTLQLSCRLQAIKPASGRGGAAEQQLMSHGSHAWSRDDPPPGRSLHLRACTLCSHAPLEDSFFGWPMAWLCRGKGIRQRAARATLGLCTPCFDRVTRSHVSSRCLPPCRTRDDLSDRWQMCGGGAWS